MTFGDAYTRWATTYDTDRNRTRDLDRMTTEVLLGDNYYDKVLELGCGTGKNTGFLVRVSRALLAIDFSVGMLEQAKVKVRSNTVLFIVADLAKSWPCQRNAFELIVCNLVLEHIEDLDAVFSQAFQALREGGLFLISELHPFRQYEGAQAVFEIENETIRIPAFVHHLSDFTNSAIQNGFSIRLMKESWHHEDEGKSPRLVSFMFEKAHVGEN